MHSRMDEYACAHYNTEKSFHKEGDFYRAAACCLHVAYEINVHNSAFFSVCQTDSVPSWHITSWHNLLEAKRSSLRLIDEGSKNG